MVRVVRVRVLVRVLLNSDPSDTVRPYAPQSLHSLIAPIFAWLPEAFWLLPACAGELL